jgi:MFS family permease
MRRWLVGALISPEYARLWYGQAVSSLGDAVFSTTLVLWVGTEVTKGKPWAPAAVSGVLVAVGAAMLFVGPLAGVLVDRWDSRRTALATEVVRGILVGMLTVVSFVPVRDLPVAAWLVVIYVVVFALNVASQFFQPSRLTMIRDIVTGEVDRARAAGIAQATGQTVTIIGPPLAAPLLFTVGVQWALLLNALSYAVSFAAIRSVPSRHPETTPEQRRRERSGVFAEFLDGLRFFRGNKTLMTLLVIAVIGQCGNAPLDTLNVFFVSRNLHSSAHLYGYLGMALGVGGVIGALCTGPMVRRFGARNVTWAGIVVLGALLAAYSRQTAFPAGLVLLFLFAIPETLVNTAVAPLLLGAAPRKYVGRTAAVFNPVNQLAGMTATVVAGWLLSSVLRNFSGSIGGLRLGPVDLIFLVSGALIIASGLYARVALRQAEVAAPAAEARPDRPVPDSAGSTP